MKLRIGLITIAALAGSAAYADTIAGSGSFGSVATDISTGTLGVCGATSCTTNAIPYWLNASSDGPGLAAYNFLTAGGAFAGQNNWLGSNGQAYLVASGNGAPTSFNFVQQAGALSISLIYANSSGVSGAEVGIYNAAASGSCTAIQNAQGVVGCSQHQYITNLSNSIGGGANAYNGDVSGALSLFNGTSNFANWGLYARTCTSATCAPAFGITTYFESNADNQYNPSLCPACAGSDASHQHWALFENATTGVFYLALEDWAFGYNGSTISPNEGGGDYNDLIFQVATSQSATPEPGTLSILGLGLAGMIAYARKLRK